MDIGVQYGYNDQLMISGVHILKLHKILRDRGIGAQFASFKKKPLKGTGTRIPNPPFSSFGPSCDYGMDLCLEVYL